MLKDWEKDDTFQRQSEMNKRNRASEAPNGIGHFVAGAIPFWKIQSEYERKHGKKMSQEKLVEKAYRKPNGEWSSDKVPIALEKYKVLCEKFSQSHPEGITEEDANKLWLEAVGERKECKAFCLASLGSSESKLRNSASTYRRNKISRSQTEELRRTIVEDTRKKTEEENQSSMEAKMEARMQQLLMKKRQEDAIIYERMFEMHRSRYALPTPQVDTTHSYAPSFGHQHRYVEQLPAFTRLFDDSAFAAVRPSRDAYLDTGFEGDYSGRTGGNFSG